MGRRRLALVLLVLLAGCGRPPQVGAENLAVIESLRTAVSTRNDTWLEDNARLIAQRHERGQLDDAQFAAFDNIIRQARGGDWAGAETQVVALAKAQRPGTPTGK
jgi:hypothetical protein